MFDSCANCSLRRICYSCFWSALLSFAIPSVTKAGRLVECPYIFQTSGKPHVKIGSENCAFIQDTECTSQTGYMHR
jgi:hypothetical protein